MEDSTAVPTRVPAGVESVKIMSFLMFKMMAVWRAWDIPRISGIVEEEVSLEGEEKLKCGDCGPNEEEYAEARTPFATCNEPSVQTRMHSVDSGEV